jgi:hypothetical protein
VVNIRKYVPVAGRKAGRGGGEGMKRRSRKMGKHFIDKGKKSKKIKEIEVKMGKK